MALAFWLAWKLLASLLRMVEAEGFDFADEDLTRDEEEQSLSKSRSDTHESLLVHSGHDWVLEGVCADL